MRPSRCWSAAPLVVRAVLPASSRVRPRLRALAKGAADQLELTRADRVHLAWLATSSADIARLDQRIRQLDQCIPPVLARMGCTLAEEVGIAAVGAMELLVEVGDPTRFATEARCARWCGVAPLAVSPGEGDGEPERHRLDLGGNRQVNRVLHTMHVTQARCHQPAKDHLRGKRAEHKTSKEARRAQATARQRRHPTHVGRPPTANIRSRARLQPDNTQGRLTKEPRAHLRRDPPPGEGDRPPTRRTVVPVAGLGGPGPGLQGLARPDDDPQSTAPAAGSPARGAGPTPRSQPQSGGGRRPCHRRRVRSRRSLRPEPFTPLVRRHLESLRQLS
jgi:Transposase IS116/IS110/IS902 family